MGSMRRWTKLFLSALLVGCAGCGASTQEIAPVHGRITLDGQPIQYASVVFTAAGKLPSGGYTDESGSYELMYKRGIKGAPIGTNHVTILQDPQRTRGPQRIPARYNENSDLQREVKPGDNEINFELTTAENAAKK